MNEPRDLVGMADEIRRKLRADDEVDRFAVRLAQINQPPCRSVRENFLLWIPLERNADDLGLISVRAQLMMQRANMVLGATVHERNLDLADDDASNTHQCEGILYRPFSNKLCPCLHCGGRRCAGPPNAAAALEWPLPQRCSSAFWSMPRC